jgi:CheY-like chemotaxis protein
MDCQMPEMDGYDATRAIRNPETPVRRHDIPILAMTAHNSEADRRKCLEPRTPRGVTLSAGYAATTRGTLGGS